MNKGSDKRQLKQGSMTPKCLGKRSEKVKRKCTKESIGGKGGKARGKDRK